MLVYRQKNSFFSILPKNPSIITQVHLKRNLMTRNIIYLLLITDLIILDQVTKYFSEKLLAQKTIEIIPQFFSLQLAHNEGIAFSLPLPPGITMGLTMIVCLYLSVEIFKSKSPHSPRNILNTFLQKPQHTAYALILAGALGNFIDRLWHGYVIDMFSVSHFAIFNVADISITLGVIGLILTEVQSKNHATTK